MNRLSVPKSNLWHLIQICCWPISGPLCLLPTSPPQAWPEENFSLKHIKGTTITTKLRCAWDGSEDTSASKFLQNWSKGVPKNIYKELVFISTNKKKANAALLKTWHPVICRPSKLLPPLFLFTSAAVPAHWHHRPTQLVRPVCQYCGVKGEGDASFQRREERRREAEGKGVKGESIASLSSTVEAEAFVPSPSLGVSLWRRG